MTITRCAMKKNALFFTFITVLLLSSNALAQVQQGSSALSIGTSKITGGTSGYYLTVGTTGKLQQAAGSTPSMAIGGAVTSGTGGSVLFVNSSNQLAQKNASFFWDNTNNRLGLGSTNPVYTLDTVGTVHASDGFYGKGIVSYGTVSSFPTGLGNYAASYYSSAYGGRFLCYDGTNYCDTGVGALVNSVPSITIKATTGRVGIGTSAPANGLDVAANGIRIGSSTPASTSNALYAIGTSLMWNGAAVGSGGGGTPGGTDGQIQYNNAGSFGGLSLGNGLVISSAVLNTQSLSRSVVTTTDTILTTDNSKTIRYSNTSGAAVTLPAATGTGFGSGFGFTANNFAAVNSENVVITPTTSTINGVASLTIPPMTGCFIYSDGSNYWSDLSSCTSLIFDTGLPVSNGGTGGTGLVIGTTGPVTLSRSHIGNLLTISTTTSAAVTVPVKSSVSFNTGEQINLMTLGTGTVTIGTTGPTVYFISPTGTSDLEINPNNGIVTLINIGSDLWKAAGEIK